MDPAEPITATTSATGSATGVPGIGFDIISPVLNFFSGNESVSGLFSLGGIIAVLSLLWSIFTILAYIVAIVFLVLYVYASVQKNLYEELQSQALRDQERLYDEQYRGKRKSNRLADVLTHIASDHPNDWKLAIIEADVILDDTLKQHGYAGNSLGERLKSVSPNQISSLNDAWEAHKIRNRIAHDGADFVLTKRIAESTIHQYQRVFDEFGVS